MKKHLILIVAVISAMLLVSCGDEAVETAKKPTHTHVFGEWNTVKEASCTDEGEASRSCECGETETKKLDITDHVYVSTVIDPTCTESGYTENVCACGRSYNSDKTQKLGHDRGEWYTVTEATCISNGLERSDCSRCGDSLTLKTDLTDHTLVWVTVTPPTCESAGEERGECATDGCEYSEMRAIDSFGGHEMSEWMVTTEATCAANGEERRECIHEGCTVFETRVINGGHKFGDYTVESYPTCTTSGKKIRECSLCGKQGGEWTNALGHSYSEWSTDKNGVTSRTCSRCYNTQKRYAASVTAIASMERYSATEKRKQGGCFNGSRFYQAFVSVGDTSTSIGMIDLKTNKVIYSKPMNLGHANDMTYNSKTNCVYVISGSTLYVFDADTLEYKGTMKLSGGASAIDYNVYNDTYVGYSSQSILVYNANGGLQSSVKVSDYGVTSQGVCSDENYVYMLFCTSIGSSKYECYVYVYDYSGVCQEIITVSIPGNHEPENLSVVDGTLYIGSCTGTSYVLLYKVNKK